MDRTNLLPSVPNGALQVSLDVRSYALVTFKDITQFDLFVTDCRQLRHAASQGFFARLDPVLE